MIVIPPCPAVVPVLWHLSIGVCIGVLGFFGIVVPLTRAQIGKSAKIVWVVVFTILLILEVISIHLEDIKQKREQAFVTCEELRSFKGITEKLDSATTASKVQYDSTISEVNGVLATTQSVATLAKEGVNNMTGGNSWGSVMAIPFSDAPNSLYLLVINNGKKYALHGVRLVIANESHGSPYRMQSCGVGDIAPHTGYNAPLSGSCVIVVDPSIRNHYLIVIGADNGGTMEELYMARGPNGIQADYEVYKSLPNGKKKILQPFSHAETSE